MGTRDTSPAEEVRFYCGHCRHSWRQAPDPDRIEPAEERPWHPWTYTAICPKCAHEAQQHGHERGLWKAAYFATGPRTDAGKARSAANLANLPAESRRNSRFNAIQSGRFARVATLFPAKPGRYEQCNGCRYLGEECCEPDDQPAGHQNPPACLLRTELFMQHHAAVESGDPALLAGLRADTQASLYAILDDMLLAVVSRGVELVSPEWYYDKEDGFKLVKFEHPDTGDLTQAYKVTANPLLKSLMDFVAKNNLSLADMGMTPKAQEREQALPGYLDQPDIEAESGQDFDQRTLAALEGLQAMLGAAKEDADNDPVLLAHKGEISD